MMSYKVEICGINTSKLPLLSPEEQERLWEGIGNGDAKAREAFIKGNLRLVLSIVQRLRNSSENVDDLFQIGCIGLIKAVDNFDVSLGVKFSTYAVPLIMGEVRRYLRDNNSIRVSRSVRDVAYKAIQAKEQWIREYNREPTMEELAASTDFSAEQIVYALDAIAKPMSIYEPVYSEGQDALYVVDQISDKKNREDNWVENIALQDALSRLSERENNIIDLRFFRGKTQVEVSREVGISQAQVSRLEKNALKAMEYYLSS